MTAPREFRTQARLSSFAQKFSPRAPYCAAASPPLKSPSVCAALLELVSKGVRDIQSAAAPEQADGVEYLCEELLAAAVSRLGVGQALPSICESGLRLTQSVCAALAYALLE